MAAPIRYILIFINHLLIDSKLILTYKCAAINESDILLTYFISMREANPATKDATDN